MKYFVHQKHRILMKMKWQVHFSSQVMVNNCLSELEAAEFAEMVSSCILHSTGVIIV